MAPNDDITNMLPIYIICVFVNGYLIYFALPYLKIDIKSKSTFSKALIIIVIFLISAFVTNAPVELLLGIPLVSS